MFCLWWQVFQNLDVLPNGTDDFSIPESRRTVVWVFLALDFPSDGLVRTMVISSATCTQQII